MNQPIVLIVDDLAGARIDVRRDLCEIYQLTELDFAECAAWRGARPSEVAAVFASGQRQDGGLLTNSVEDAVAAAQKGWPFPGGRRWALTLLDLRFVSGAIQPDGMPEGRPGDDEFGLRILSEFRLRFPELPVVVLSSRDRTEVVETCRRLGASDFIQRHSPGDTDRPSHILRSKLRQFGLLEDERGFIVGRSLPILQAISAARRAATGGGNILVLGETGTGKELLARFIHDESPKREGPYRVFHPFAAAESLQEDLLFGHVKGAFTDAKTDRVGLFEEANGGTLFIDEIGDVPPTLQDKLLRPLESRQVVRQGGGTDVDLDLQVVLATNKELDDAAARGAFRIDLLNRIKAYTITLPPLRVRQEDTLPIARALLESLCREHGVRWPREISADAAEVLQSLPWREGNIRELRNVLERAIKDHPDSEIVVAADFEGGTAHSTSIGSATIPSGIPSGSTTPIEADFVKALRSVQFSTDYSTLHNSWPRLRTELLMLLGRYLSSTLHSTKLRRPGSKENDRINLAGAVGCLLGRRVSTLQAADFVKRVLSLGGDPDTAAIDADPILRDAYEAALRARPRRMGKSIARRRRAGN